MLLANTTLLKDKHKLCGVSAKSKRLLQFKGRLKERSTIQEVHTVDCSGPPIFGYKAYTALTLIKEMYAIIANSKDECSTHPVDILNKYSNIFKGIGEFQGECSFTHPMWINALVIYEKPRTHKLYVCLAPRPLIKAIMRPP